MKESSPILSFRVGSLCWLSWFYIEANIVLEQQIKNLVAKQKEMKLYVKEEFKKIQLRLEKEVMDAQQEGNSNTVQM